MVTVALVDDHILLRKGLANLLRDHGYQVLFEADHGKHMMAQLQSQIEPSIILLDINMPQMDGYEAAGWLKVHCPDTRILALSMYDDENAILRMVKNGARGYILKDSEPEVLLTAINQILTRGYYYSEMLSSRLIHSLLLQEGHTQENSAGSIINDRELEFLRFACTELTYKEIADQMNCSPRTVDGYRDALFEKLQVRSRVGLVLFALKNGLVKL